MESTSVDATIRYGEAKGEIRPLPRLAKAGLLTIVLSLPVLATEGSYILRRNPRLVDLERNPVVVEYREAREQLLNLRSRLLDVDIDYQQLSPQLASAHGRYREAAQNPEVKEWGELERSERQQPILPRMKYGISTFLAGVGMLAFCAYRDSRKK